MSYSLFDLQQLSDRRLNEMFGTWVMKLPVTKDPLGWNKWARRDAAGRRWTEEFPDAVNSLDVVYPYITAIDLTWLQLGLVKQRCRTLVEHIVLRQQPPDPKPDPWRAPGTPPP